MPPKENKYLRGLWSQGYREISTFVKGDIIESICGYVYKVIFVSPKTRNTRLKTEKGKEINCTHQESNLFIKHNPDERKGSKI